MQPLVVNLCIKQLFLLCIVLLPKAENVLSTVTNGLNKNQCSMLECSRISVKFIHLFYPRIFHKSVESLLTFDKILKKLGSTHFALSMSQLVTWPTSPRVISYINFIFLKSSQIWIFFQIIIGKVGQVTNCNFPQWTNLVTKWGFLFIPEINMPTQILIIH